MSLHRRLIFAITLLLVALLAASLIVNVNNARVNLYQQLSVHAQDTATSLGFTITQAAQAEDLVQVSSMIDVIFDRGYYQRILYQDLEGKELVKRELSLSSIDVPEWFIQLFELPEVAGSADIAAGWYQLGTIEVVSYPAFAYLDLWRSFKEQLWLFVISLVAAYGLAGIGLKYILQPVRKVEEQAEAISNREFMVQDTLPKIPELRSMVVAMNQMVKKVQSMFSHQVALNDRLHHQSRTDEVTGLSNRHDFDERLQAWLTSERGASAGVLVLIQAGDLMSINRIEGRESGDVYLIAIANSLTQCVASYPEALCSRHRGADFALFIPMLTEGESQELAQTLYSELQTLGGEEQTSGVYISAIYAPLLSDYGDDEGNALLANADNYLSQLQSEQSSGVTWNKLKSEESPVAVTTEEWLAWFNDALAQEAIGFRFQPVWQVIHGEKHLLFNEVLTQLTPNGQSYSARTFIPMAARLQKMTDFDRLVIDKVIEEKMVMPEKLCINIAIASLQEAEFIQHIRSLLEAHPLMAQRITFELPASGLSYANGVVRDFARLVKQYGAGFSLHHFGRDTARFAYLQTLPLDYLKIDRCFIQSIDTDKDAQFFVQSLATIAKSCDVIVLAEGVEREAQWKKLLELGIQGGQGFWLGQPQATPVVG